MKLAMAFGLVRFFFGTFNCSYQLDLFLVSALLARHHGTMRQSLLPSPRCIARAPRFGTSERPMDQPLSGVEPVI